MRTLTVTWAVWAVFLSLAPVVAQVQAPLHVEAFGGIQDSLPPVLVPPELKPFVPSSSTLRAVLTTNMASSGEKVFLYDDGEDVFPQVHLHGLRYGKEFKLFDGSVAAIAGLLPLTTSNGLQLVSFAYHQGGDQSDTRFVIFAHEHQGYRSVFQKETREGQMRILAGSALWFELWNADTSLDPKESCVWCPHRYRVETYELKGDSFVMVAQRTTKKFLSPSEIAGKPFIVAEVASDKQR